MAIVVSLAAVVSPAGAQSWTTTLNGASENPPNGSAGVGTASFSLAGNLFTISATFSGLTGTTTASHIHCCVAPPGTAGVATQVPTFTGFPLGVSSGSYLNTFDLSLASSWNPAFLSARGNSTAAATADLVAGMNAGTAYLNIHTSVFPGGEIRGFITTVPEPGTWVLMASGLVVIGAAVRRRRA